MREQKARSVWRIPEEAAKHDLGTELPKTLNHRFLLFFLTSPEKV